MPGTRDLGQVAAVYFGDTPPDNTDLIWMDTSGSVVIPKVFDTVLQAWVGLSASPILYHNQSGNYTVQPEHLAYLVDFDGTSFTLPNNSTVPLPVGFWILGRKKSTSTSVTIVAAGGVTVETPGGALRPFQQYSQFTAIKVATNTWAINGELIV
jgi:hypothetical protein